VCFAEELGWVLGTIFEPGWPITVKSLGSFSDLDTSNAPVERRDDCSRNAHGA
jgi:hypothetical protein